MKGKKWDLKRKMLSRGGLLLGCSLSCLFCAVSNCSKASALTITSEVAPTGNSFSVGADLRCDFATKTGNYIAAGSAYGECQANQSQTTNNLKNIYKQTPIETKKGNYYATTVTLQSKDGVESVVWSPRTNYDDWDIVEIKSVYNGANYGQFPSIYRCTNGICVPDTIDQPYWAESYEIVLRAKKDGRTIFTLKSEAGVVINSRNFITMSDIVEYEVQSVAEKIEAGNKAEEERWEEENKKAEEAVNSKQETGAEGSDEAAKDGLNIFKLILETPAGSCKLPEISAFGFSLGELDLCTYKPPSWLQQVMGAVVTITLAGASIKCTTRVLDQLGRAYGGTR